MTLIDLIVADIGDFKACKQIRPFDLKDWGYKFSKRKIKILNATYTLFEVLDNDTSKSVAFSFLFSKKTTMGIIIPHTFDRYLDKYFADKKDKGKNKKTA